jgi:hypothetical protein
VPPSPPPEPSRVAAAPDHAEEPPAPEAGFALPG